MRTASFRRRPTPLFWALMLLFATLLVTMTSHSAGSKLPAKEATEILTPTAQGSFVHTVVNVTTVKSTQGERVLKNAKVLEKIINSTDFKEAILNHKFKDKLQFNENKSLSNFEIYEAIRKGNENGSGDDYSWRLNVRLERKDWFCLVNEVARNIPNSYDIVINTCILDTYSDQDMVTTMAHEEMHKLGFSHAFKHNPDRPFTVPYAVGQIAGNLYVKFKD